MGPSIWDEVQVLYDEGLRQTRQGVVGCLIRRPDGRIFAQRRSFTRLLFPGCWDLVGGHIEADETPFQAVVREISEETGWRLDQVFGLRKVVDWESADNHGVLRLKREFVLAVSVTGDWEQPRLEHSKVLEGRWLGPADLPLLLQNRPSGDQYVYDLVREELLR